MKDISIIVPAFNAAPFIERCIMSLLDQDLPPESYEIIVTDDASSDDTAAILDRMSSTASNLCVLHNEHNRGIACTRNRGLEVAEGRYILFVDADDWWEPRTMGQVIAAMERDSLDMAAFGHYFNDENGERCMEVDPAISHGRVISGAEYIASGMKQYGVWAYMYRRSLLEENGLRMDSDFAEDLLFNAKAFAMCRRIRFCGLHCYHYGHNPASVSRDFDMRHLFTYIDVADEMQRFASSLSDPETARRLIRHRECDIYMVMRRALRENTGFEERLARHIRAKRHLHPVECSALDWRRRLFNFDPRLYVWIYKHTHAHCLRRNRRQMATA